MTCPMCQMIVMCSLWDSAHRGFRLNNRGMPTRKQARRKVPPLVAAIVRPVSTRLSHMEDLLIEMRGEYDVNLKKINKLQAQLDTLTDIVSRRLI